MGDSSFDTGVAARIFIGEKRKREDGGEQGKAVKVVKKDEDDVEVGEPLSSQVRRGWLVRVRIADGYAQDKPKLLPGSQEVCRLIDAQSIYSRSPQRSTPKKSTPRKSVATHSKKGEFNASPKITAFFGKKS